MVFHIARRPSLPLLLACTALSCTRGEPPAKTSSESGPAAEPAAASAPPADPLKASNASAPLGTPVGAALLESVVPVNDQTVLVTFLDGKAKLPTLGKGDDGSIEYALLDVHRAVQPASYEIASPDDEAYSQKATPVRVGRKSKAVDFANCGGQTRWVMQHSIVLTLPKPMQSGKKYVFGVGDLSRTEKSMELTFNDRVTRSEAVHANQVGYAPSAPLKYAYLSAWLGDQGAARFDAYENASFRVVDVATGASAHEGKVKLRKRHEGGEPDSGYGENFNQADVWELDFSALKTPGSYRVCVERVGCSYPFEVAPDVHRSVYTTLGRALYHQRCGTELTEPHTKLTRPKCHHPDIRPIKQTSHRHIDESHGNGWAEAEKHITGEERKVWGGYHDAGDWDREAWHTSLSDDLLLAYELSPTSFGDGDFNIPESGNGIPDVVDSAAWNVDYYRRSQRKDGGVGVGLFESRWPNAGETSWTDTLGWYMYAEDPAQSYRYAATAARLSWVYGMLGKPALGKPYLESALKAYAWAQKNTKPGDDDPSGKWGGKTRDVRVLAAAALFKATRDGKYETAFKKELKVKTGTTLLMEWEKWDQEMAVYTYVTTDVPGMDAALKAELIRAVQNFAQAKVVETAKKRSMRHGYDWHKPTSWGALSHAKTQPLMVAHALTKDPKYLGYYYTTLDYQLGANQLNMVWMTGVGHNPPKRVYHPDTKYTRDHTPVAGIIPMGPYKFEKSTGDGPWDTQYAMQTAYPDAKAWPVSELWFNNHYAPATSEFVTNDISHACALYGYLIDK